MGPAAIINLLLSPAILLSLFTKVVPSKKVILLMSWKKIIANGKRKKRQYVVGLLWVKKWELIVETSRVLEFTYGPKGENNYLRGYNVMYYTICLLVQT